MNQATLDGPSEETTRQIVKLLIGHNTIKRACEAVNITRADFYLWMEHGENGRTGYVDFYKTVTEALDQSRKDIMRAANKHE